MHALLCLHVWLLLVRLRPEGKSGKQLAQMLYDNFQDDVEKRAREAGVKVRAAVLRCAVLCCAAMLCTETSRSPWRCAHGSVLARLQKAVLHKQPGELEMQPNLAACSTPSAMCV